MKKLVVKKSSPLYGTITTSGSKNSALPIIASALLSGEECVFKNIPNLEDIQTMLKLLKSFGVKNNFKNSEIKVNASNVNYYRADYELVRKMRASILVLGPLLARKRRAVVSLPGGCAIGTRPIDLHLFGMRKLGADIYINNGYVVAEAKHGLVGNLIKLPFKSVGATENILLGSAIAKGTTLIKNAAKEPEIEDLCNCLNKMGSKISGIGTSELKIEGVKNLSGVQYSIIPDRIVAGTLIIAALITRGILKITKIYPNHLDLPIRILKKMGADISIAKNHIVVNGKNSQLKSVDIVTEPYPGFPTDLQAQFMSLLAIVKGNSSVQEKIFENRFMHVGELNRLGANIKVNKDRALINGVDKLKGAEVMASDLRASVSLVLAGLMAQGETHINRIYHLDRGYENIEKKLNSCGAKIKRI